MYTSIDEVFVCKGIPFKRVKNDIYGNPSYIIKNVMLISDEEFESLESEKYSEIAKKRANDYGMRVNRMKDYPNTFIFQSYSIETDAKYIAEIQAGDKKGVGI